MDWRGFIHYPQYIPAGNRAMLDMLAELVPIVRHDDDYDKYSTMFRWLREIKASGLVTNTEYQTLRSNMAENQ